MNRYLPRIDSHSLGILLLIAVTCLVAWLLYPRPEQEARSKGVREIVYWTHMDPLIFDSMKPLVEEFNRRHAGQYIVRMGTASTRATEGDSTRFMLSVTGGVPPDVIYFNRPFVVEWASRGAFTDLNPYIEQDRSLPDGVKRENYYDVAWDESIYRGANYAIGNSIDSRVLYYNYDPLIRAGFVYQSDDPDVLAGKASLGDPRPPKTWEEVSLKRLDAMGTVRADGMVSLDSHVRRVAVNEDVPEGAPIDLIAAGVRPGDVVALTAGVNVFRGRIASIEGPDRFRIDIKREQPKNQQTVPVTFCGRLDVKIFDQDGYVNRLTRFDPVTGGITDAGFIPMFGNSWLVMYGWLNGGDFMSPDGEKCTMDDPQIVQALQWLVDVYDSMGGMEEAMKFQVSAASGGLDPFVNGKVALRIDTSGLNMAIIAFKPDLQFGVVAAPIPAKRLAEGFSSFGWGGGFAYAIPSTAREKDGGWELIRWLSSEEANQIYCQAQAAIYRSRGQPYFPLLHPDRRVMDWILKTYIAENPELSPYIVRAFEKFIEMLPNNRNLPTTPVGQMLWTEQVRASESAMRHADMPYDALNYGKRRIQASLDDILHPPTGPVVRWKWIIALYVLSIVMVFVVLAMVQARKRHGESGRLGRWLDGYVAASPWLMGLVVFGAGPIIFSLIISFCNYDVLSPARFIGFDNYVKLLGRHYDEVVGVVVWNDPIFWRSLANTLYMVISVPLSILLGLVIALLLDSRVRGLHVYRTIFYLPAIVPAVASFILWIWVFDPSRGMLNQILIMFGATNPPNWLQDPQWAKPAIIMMGLWGVGASMIIWLAGLKDIPVSMYEAASIDGAGRIRQFFHVTIPLLTPYIFFNMVMGLIGVFQIFEQAYIMTEGGPADATLFYAYKLFNEAFRFINMGIASAMAWILFLIVLLITLFQLWASKKWVHYGG